MGTGYRIRDKGDARGEILLYEDIGSGWFGGVDAKGFAADLKALGGVAALDVRINSAGGDVFDGLAIYRMIADHPAKVTVHIDGVAASIASIIAMAGDTIRMSQAGFVMIHNASGLTVGDAGDHRATADILDTVTATLAEVYAARSGQPLDGIKALMAAETWFTAAQALDHGLVTEVVDNVRMAAHWDPAKHPFRHLPKDLAGRPVRDQKAEVLARMEAIRFHDPDGMSRSRGVGR